jgi:hypothetical protein
VRTVAPGDGGLHEREQSGRGGVPNDLHAHASAAGPADLDGDTHECLLAAGAPATQSLLVTANETLVDLNRVAQRLALGVDHGSAQLVQHHPRRLVALDPELTTQLQRGDIRRRRRHQVGGAEPQVQRGVGLVQHRARCHRRLPVTGSTLPHGAALRDQPGTLVATPGTAEPIRPPAREQVVRARILVRETVLELHDRSRELGSPYPPYPT